MKKKVHKETEMVKAVKELESGMTADVVAREHGISRETLYSWKSKFCQGKYVILLNYGGRKTKYHILLHQRRNQR